MCLNPQSVPNPLYKKRGYFSQFGSIYEVPIRATPTTEFIEVPCGKCAECRDSYFNSILQRAICEARSSYMYFVTLTYDDKHIPFIDLDDERILYADYKHIQDMVKRFRASNRLDRDFRYLCVNEYGDNYSRPHFHLIFFVAKSNKDDESTKYLIEKILYDSLKEFFAVNVGTRKHPHYECLFTHRIRMTSKGPMSNYWVKLVENDTADYLKDFDESTSIRTIRYLIGYVQTTHRSDVLIEDYCNMYYYDTIRCDKVRRLLSNRVRFSKGFGCGFVDLKKFYLPKISCRASSNILTYSEICKYLPVSLEEFTVNYPAEFEKLMDWVSLDKYSCYTSLKECLESFSVDDFYMHCLAVRYLPKQTSFHFKNIYKDSFFPTISSFFQVLQPYKYSLKNVTTQLPTTSDLFDFLRNGVDRGINDKVPFIAFPIKSQQGYFAMCKYYRDRVTTLDDIIRMYDACNIRNFDDWKSKFLKSYNSRKADKALGNVQKYKEYSEIILKNQKKSLSLRQRISNNIYHLLFRSLA